MSIIQSDFLWLSRSGSIITILGVFLTVKHSVFSESRDLDSIVKEKNHYAVFAPERDSDLYKQNIKYAKVVLRDEYIGFVLTILGTVIWGYGDLLNFLFV